MSEAIIAYLNQERERYVEELKAFIRIPSVSASSLHKNDMRKAAVWLSERLEQAGLEHVQILETDGNPVVYADWLHAPGKPTALIYGHYDVQPADPLEQWETPPFEPVVRDGKLFGRGATDDKAQLYTQVATVEAYLKTLGSLPVNVKFCIEGEEEIASPNLPAFVNSHAELLQADLIAISDGPMVSKDQPSICYGLRGLSGFELELKGPKSDLHSGLYGGGVANPATALVKILGSMKDEQDRILVEGFYEGVHELTEADHQAFREIPFSEEDTRKELQVAELAGEEGYTFLERTSARPTLEINGIYGGYQGEGLKPIVPAAAGVKLSCRLVDDQDPDDIFAKVKKHVEAHTPAGVTVSMKQSHRGKPFYISPQHPYIRAAAVAYEAGFGKKPVYIRSGGSIPVIEVFARVLNAPVVMLDFGLPEENMHAPNEYFQLENFDRGTATLCRFWQEIGGSQQ
ncbi:dipeptidase [Gorillibacterium sp. sgz5001074]|uniref:dipeptidase n=1 Tax=Gorillibacterium sp. sgz5001074 TaxID=3446695 RepID=UPI003F66856A